MKNLHRRVEALEGGFEGTTSDPRELTAEELQRLIHNSLEEDFKAGKYKDIEQKVKAYEAAGKTFADIGDEEPDWYNAMLKRLIEEENRQ